MGSPAAAWRVRLVRGLSRGRGGRAGDRVVETRARPLDDGAHRRSPRSRVRAGRVGCFLVNDGYGIPSTLPWAMKFPRGLPPTTVAELSTMHVHFPPGTDPMQVVAVHPTQIYETALMLLAFAWLWRLRDHRHGTGWRFGVYLVLAGAERFLVETVRAKDDRLLGPFTLAQVTSVLLVLAGVWLMQRLRAPGPATVAVPPALKPQPQAQATP